MFTGFISLHCMSFVAAGWRGGGWIKPKDACTTMQFFFSLVSCVFSDISFIIYFFILSGFYLKEETSSSMPIVECL